MIATGLENDQYMMLVHHLCPIHSGQHSVVMVHQHRLIQACTRALERGSPTAYRMHTVGAVQRAVWATSTQLRMYTFLLCHRCVSAVQHSLRERE